MPEQDSTESRPLTPRLVVPLAAGTPRGDQNNANNLGSAVVSPISDGSKSSGARRKAKMANAAEDFYPRQASAPVSPRPVPVSPRSVRQASELQGSLSYQVPNLYAHAEQEQYAMAPETPHWMQPIDVVSIGGETFMVADVMPAPSVVSSMPYETMSVASGVGFYVPPMQAAYYNPHWSAPASYHTSQIQTDLGYGGAWAAAMAAAAAANYHEPAPATAYAEPAEVSSSEATASPTESPATISPSESPATVSPPSEISGEGLGEPKVGAEQGPVMSNHIDGIEFFAVSSPSANAATGQSLMKIAEC